MLVLNGSICLVDVDTALFSARATSPDQQQVEEIYLLQEPVGTNQQVQILFKSLISDKSTILNLNLMSNILFRALLIN